MAALLAYRRYTLPFQTPVRTAHGPWGERTGLLVRVETEGPRIGFGEIAPLPWFGTETTDEAETALQSLGGLLTAPLLAAFPRHLACTRHGLAEALAATADTATNGASAPYLSVAALLPAGRPALAVATARADAGFRTFKWKVGVGDPADELGLLDDLLARLPEGARLRLDANGAWDRRQTERWLDRCADRPIEHVEQPIAPATRGAADLLLGLAHDYPTPLALDESLVRDGDVDRWLDAGWPDVWVIKPTLLADPAAAIGKLARRCVPVVFSSALETALGAGAALRHAFAWPGEKRALGFGVWPLFADRRFDGPAAAPFIRAEDLARLPSGETLWNALS